MTANNINSRTPEQVGKEIGKQFAQTTNQFCEAGEIAEATANMTIQLCTPCTWAVNSLAFQTDKPRLVLWLQWPSRIVDAVIQTLITLPLKLASPLYSIYLTESKILRGLKVFFLPASLFVNTIKGGVQVAVGIITVALRIFIPFQTAYSLINSADSSINYFAWREASRRRAKLEKDLLPLPKGIDLSGCWVTKGLHDNNGVLLAQDDEKYRKAWSQTTLYYA